MRHFCNVQCVSVLSICTHIYRLMDRTYMSLQTSGCWSSSCSGYCTQPSLRSRVYSPTRVFSGISRNIDTILLVKVLANRQFLLCHQKAVVCMNSGTRPPDRLDIFQYPASYTFFSDLGSCFQ